MTVILIFFKVYFCDDAAMWVHTVPDSRKGNAKQFKKNEVSSHY